MLRRVSVAVMDRETLVAVFRAAVRALDPADLVANELRRRDLGAGTEPVTVLALGKAAAAMVAGAARILGNRLTGVAVTLEPAELPAGVAGYVGAHPVPDESSLAAGEALLAGAAAVPEDGLVLCLISGGGSALAEAPVVGVTLQDVAVATKELLGSGADIAEVNAVRRALSRIKGGGLAAAMGGSRLVTLAISDVGKADPATIASGPTLAPAGGVPAAASVISAYGLAPRLPGSVVAAAAHEAAPIARAHDFSVIADGRTAAAAAAVSARHHGLRPRVADEPLSGEARLIAAQVVAAGAAPGEVAIYWGETTVAVVGTGSGGRNQEAALAAAVAIDGRSGVFLAAGTDGIDGTTDAAGAVVDADTAADARRLGLDPAAYLAANNSGAFFTEVPGRVVTGRTGTNVADLWMCTVPAEVGTPRK